MANDNKLLGQFNLEGIPPAPRGIPQIEVTFDIDANGIVNVSAKDKGTGKEHKITIQASGGLSKEEIDEMVANAEKHAEEDQKKRDLVEAKNQADTLVYSTEKALSEHGDKIGENEKTQITEKVEELKKLLEDENIDAETLNKKVEEVSKTAMQLGQAMYQANGSSPQAEASNTEEANESDNSDEKVVDADFEKVDDNDDDSKSSTGS